jgi:hypothetical protein
MSDHAGLPLDPEEHPIHAVVPEPSEAMLRSMRRAVEMMGGTVLPDHHGDRTTLIKKDINKPATYSYPLTGCGRDRVLIELPLGKDKPVRLCMVCDSWHRVLESLV